MTTKEKGNELILPKTYSEFFPKNYVKKKKTSFEEYIPTKKKEVPSLIYPNPKYHKNKNKFNINNNNNNNQNQIKDEDNFDEEYSGLISKNYKKKENIKNNKNKIKIILINFLISLYFLFINPKINLFYLN